MQKNLECPKGIPEEKMSPLPNLPNLPSFFNFKKVTMLDEIERIRIKKQSQHHIKYMRAFA